MKMSTKISLTVILIGAFYESSFNNDYKEAYSLLLVAVLVLTVWYNESKN